jgi:hypothetical protein
MVWSLQMLIWEFQTFQKGKKITTSTLRRSYFKNYKSPWRLMRCKLAALGFVSSGFGKMVNMFSVVYLVFDLMDMMKQMDQMVWTFFMLVNYIKVE